VRIPATLIRFTKLHRLLEGKRGFKRTKNPVESCNKANKTIFR